MAKRRPALQTQITSLLASTEPTLSYGQIAEIVGCSSKTVQRVATAIKPDVEAVEEKLQEYRTLMREALPLADRVKRLKQLVNQDDQLMVALKALEKVDRLDGLDNPKEENAPQPAPLFALPPGTRLRLDILPVEPELPSAPPIDVEATPVENEPE